MIMSQEQAFTPKTKGWKPVGNEVFNAIGPHSGGVRARPAQKFNGCSPRTMIPGTRTDIAILENLQ